MRKTRKLAKFAIEQKIVDSVLVTDKFEMTIGNSSANIQYLVIDIKHLYKIFLNYLLQSITVIVLLYCFVLSKYELNNWKCLSTE